MEIRVMDLLNKKGFNLIQNPKEREMDLIIAREGIEIKFEEYALYSGNFYIEFEAYGKPSGLFKEDKLVLGYWCHTDGRNVYLLKGKDFQKWVTDRVEDCRNNKSLTSKGFRLIENGGNGGRTKGLLVPVEKLKEQAIYIYNLGEDDG